MAATDTLTINTTGEPVKEQLVPLEQTGSQTLKDLAFKQQMEMIRSCTSWQESYPNVVKMARMDKIALKYLPKFVKRTSIYPVSGTLDLSETLCRTESSFKASLNKAFAPKVQNAPWSNAELNAKLLEKLADDLYKKVEVSIKAAEKDRSVYEWFLRSDVMNRVHLASFICHKVNHLETFVIVEGFAEVVRKKAWILGAQDTAELKMNLDFKAITIDIEKMTDNEKSATDGKIANEIASYDPFDDSDSD
mmetsp:Transcript_85784/g.157319  ORF Transcript_85784/g.157319 Transcript_85784/m.157319 type:complete len:249 (-) Transcript_85784:202-948(-)